MNKKRIIIFIISIISLIGYLEYSKMVEGSLPIKITKIKNPRKGLLNVGNAVYALTSDSFDCDNFFRTMKGIPEWHISFLYNSFGNNFDCLKRIMDSPQIRTIQVHLINEASPRAGTAQWYEFHKPYSLSEYNKVWENNDKTLLKNFSKYVNPLQELFQEYLPARPHIQCIIGPGLESNVGQAAAENMVDASRLEFPYCKISWNGMKSIAWNSDIVEKHGSNPNVYSPCLVDLDGQDIDFPERPSEALHDGNDWTDAVSIGSLRKYIEKLANRCEVYYLWAWESNCSTTGAKRDPNQRNRDCGSSQVNLVLTLISDEIKWANKNANVNPEVYNWSYDEQLPLKLCKVVKNKQLKFKTTTTGGKVTVSSSYQLETLNVLYKQNVIDVYSLVKDNGTQQIWKSKIKPNIRYPYKTVFVGTFTSKNNINKTVCWKVNSPLN